jgi:hypothetical protein
MAARVRRQRDVRRRSPAVLVVGFDVKAYFAKLPADTL